MPQLLRLPPLPLPSRSTTLLISLMCLRTLRRIWGEKSSPMSLCQMRHRMRPRAIQSLCLSQTIRPRATSLHLQNQAPRARTQHKKREKGTPPMCSSSRSRRPPQPYWIVCPSCRLHDTNSATSSCMHCVPCASSTSA